VSAGVVPPPGVSGEASSAEIVTSEPDLLMDVNLQQQV